MFNFLSFKTKNFLPEALDCILCADEMSIKTHIFYNVSKDKIIGLNQAKNCKTYEPANHPLVFIIRGIIYSWKQPISYYLISNSCSGMDLNDIIYSTIHRLHYRNINVKAFITDQGPNFIQFSNNNNISPIEPYFEVDEKRVVYLFDPPHLLKSTRNMFFKHNFYINDDLVEKRYLNTYYNYDSKCNDSKIDVFARLSRTI